MNKNQVLILDCNGQMKPVLCFYLEVAGFDIRVVTEEDEAINLLSNSRLTGERFSELVINNPYLNVDISGILQAIEKVGIDIPVVFVKESKSFSQLVESRQFDSGRLKIYHVEPAGTVDLLKAFRSSAVDAIDNHRVAS